MKKRIAYCCENSAYKAAEALRDEGGIPADVEIIKVPCAGRVEVAEILHAYENGIEAVLVAACPLDNCKYLRGNRRTMERVQRVKKALRDAGIDDGTLRMEFLSSVDTHKLREALEALGAARAEVAL